MNRILVVAFICIVSQSLYAQTIRDNVFNDVIVIDESNSAGTSNIILNFPIEITPDKPLVIYNRNPNLPNKLFLKPEFLRIFLLKVSNFQLISDDPALRKKMYAEMEKEKGCSKPQSPSYFLYQATLLDKKVVIDSLYIDPTHKNQPVLNFKKKPVIPENHILVYYTDAWGSMCCPKDSKWSSKEQITYHRKENLANFTFKNAKTYSRNMGEEGEYSIYFTLNNFTLADKLKFILLMKASSIINPELKEISNFPHPEIYFPYYIENYNLKEIEYNVSNF